MNRLFEETRKSPREPKTNDSQTVNSVLTAVNDEELIENKLKELLQLVKKNVIPNF